MDMDIIQPVISRFPLREFEVRRLSKHDPTFQSICADYAIAVSALYHWQEVLNDGDPASLQKVADYSRLLDELAAEILVKLDKVAPKQ
ncbi:MAG: hypothetical protein KKB37_14590 [Alphaproteobacteria bacterium]|nr:hypothetical protein [Alphaproteobacteria bacterium]